MVWLRRGKARERRERENNNATDAGGSMNIKGNEEALRSLKG